MLNARQLTRISQPGKALEARAITDLELPEIMFLAARLTDYHEGDHRIFGYIEGTQWSQTTASLDDDRRKNLGLNEKEPWWHWFNLGGIIEIPFSTITALRNIPGNAKLDELFRKDFGVSDHPQNYSKGYRYSAAPIREEEYFHAFHPQDQTPKKGQEEFLLQLRRAEFIMQGYVDRMAQWITHALSGKHGKSPVGYKDRAKLIADRTITCGRGDPLELCPELYTQTLLLEISAQKKGSE